ncbi:helix-turn-helix domain-containing protein [Actinospica robiniae]|uniref:helix-turn-helix domain-containing protein n=1 Tax=Actinospica robiniae TaxID=304901 RepID=UPI0004028CA3|nr:helix-turn-helix transcriptional regulator [Actinospica robiniae]
MARKEKPVDPGGGPLAEFARDLRALRAEAGNMTYRALAKRAGYSASTLSIAASGTMLPSLDVTLAYAQACGGDSEAWRARWHQVAEQFAELVNDRLPTYEGKPVGLSLDRARLGVFSPVDGADSGPRRGMRALIASVIAGAVVLLVCVGGFRLAGALRPRPVSSTASSYGLPARVTVSTIPVSTAATGAVLGAESSCGSSGTPRPEGSTLPASLPGDVQHLPGEFGPGSLAGGPLLPASFGSQLAGPPAVAAVAGSLVDVTGAGYIDPRQTDNGGEPYMYVTIGTPKPGQCWELLAYDTLAIAAGRGDVGDISTVDPGPHLSAAHVVLECGQVLMVTDICAWAGPGPAGRQPVFGLVRVIPGFDNTSRLKSGAMLTFVDQVYATLSAT